MILQAPLCRIFVTAALSLGISFMWACSQKPDRQVSMDQGNENLKKADKAAQSLSSYNIVITSAEVKDKGGKNVDLKVMAAGYPWQGLSGEQRREVREKLNEIVSLLNKVLEVDNLKGIYLDHKDQVIRRRDLALAYKKSLEEFEKNR